ncbi:MAG: hypothetical protein PHC52_07865, partial [Syntrophales bacterium]|nr:hypothetical protein [Syntrophales bacterium]
MRDLNEKAKQAKEKKAALGPDIDLTTFDAEPVGIPRLDSPSQLPEKDRERMLQAGVDASEEGRSGTYIQKDTAVVYSHSSQDGLLVLPIKQALEEHQWARDYYWKL